MLICPPSLRNDKCQWLELLISGTISHGHEDNRVYKASVYVVHLEMEYASTVWMSYME